MNNIHFENISILIIEDDPGDYGLIKAHVQLAGLVSDAGKTSLVWAKTLISGMAAALCNKPDILLLDLSLPDSAGIATVLAARAALHDVPIVVLSGHDDNALAIASLKAGAQDYLVKGHFEHDALGRAVRYALVRGALEQELERKNYELRMLNDSKLQDLAVANDILSQIMRSDGLRDPQIRYFLRPAELFSGDLIAASRDAQGDLRVMLADVTGHGLQAGLFLQRTFRIFYAMVKKGFRTGAIVAEINQAMLEMSSPERFIAAAVVHISSDGSVIEIWNGGIPTAIYVQTNGELHSFHSNYLPLGILGMDDFVADTEIYHALPGALLICSDGLTEAENMQGVRFGEERLENLLRNLPHGLIFDQILSELEAHLGDAVPHDDLSMVFARCGA